LLDATGSRTGIFRMSDEKTMKPADPCPCTSGRPYQECCGRWHGGAPAPDAQALMRSRYSAFVVCNEPYLLATWHQRTRPISIAFDRNQKWLGLSIVDVLVTGETSAEVEFIARFRVGGASASRLHERSRFVLEEGRWLYVDGDLRRSEFPSGRRR
jgi:SEC-C motif-containing protein